MLPIIILAVSLVSVAFSLFAEFFGMLWPANAIILIALLSHRRTWNNYASIIFGAAAAMTIAARSANNSLGLCLVLTAANILEIATALLLLAIVRINTVNTTSFRNLLMFILLAGGVAPIASATISAIAFGTVHDMP